MAFSKEDRERLDISYNQMQLRIDVLRKSEWIRSFANDRPHILRQYERYAAMSPEELMEAIEADYVIFADYIMNME